MKGTSLLVEHRHNGRVLKKLRLTAGGRPMVIGASPKADIRMVGPEVSPFHAVLEWRGGRWFVFDFASTSGTWVNKESVVELEIDKATVINIGLHEIYAQPVAWGRDLFKDDAATDRSITPAHHQVVLRTEAGVIETHLLGVTEAYKINIDGAEKVFQAPSSQDWVTHKEGRLVIQQRLVGDPGRASREHFGVNKDVKWPAFGAVLMSLIVAVVVGLKPGSPKAPKELPELQNNRFAALIYDAKVVAEKKKESMNMIAEKKTKAGALKAVKNGDPNGGGNANGQSGAGSGGSLDDVAKGVGGIPGTKLISQVRSKNLSMLIGKVAKRAASGVSHIYSLGKTADVAGTGRAVAGVTSLEGATLGSGYQVLGAGHPDGKGYRLANVGTGGRGGGGNYKEGTGLGLGSIGTSNVGIIEEESEISGGLDRDVIAEVIKSELGQIRYCYERQLAGHPDLYGKVMVKFSIGSEGSVVEQRIGTTTLNNADVEGCILRRVARWKFPNPKGGTTVIVSYPFLFKSTN